MRSPCRSGFTLVELAIVLVIIALLVGGVLVGQDLIRNAAIKGTISQIEKYNTGAGAFRTKFTALPGDISPTRATRFGLQPRAGSDGRGDADGLVENFGVAANKRGLGGETALFWRDLWEAQLISIHYITATDAIVDSSAFVSPAVEELSPYIPLLKIRPDAMLHIYPANGVNTYHLGAFASGAATGVISWRDILSPLEARAIDMKLDDGLPLNGTVRPVTDQNVEDTGGAPSATTCVDNTQDPVVYSTTTEDYSNLITCQLRIRAAF